MSSLILPRRHITPSYSQGFARSAVMSAYPGLWTKLVGLWAPSLGPSGLTLNDWSGFQNDGVLTGMDPASDWVMTEKGMVLRYSGSGVVDCGNATILDVGTKMTVTVMFRRAQIGVAYEYIVAKRDGAASSWHILLSQVNDAIRMTGGDVYLDSTQLITDFEWHVVSAVYDNLQYTLYIDGEFDSTAAKENGIISEPTVQVSIGARWSGYPTSLYHYTGDIAGVNIYNRVLSFSEIQVLARDPFAPLRLRDSLIPISGAAPPAGTVNPFSMGAINLLHGKLAG